MTARFDMPAAEYHAMPGVSNSMLSDMARSPAHCWALHHAPGRPARKTTASMQAGTLLHALVLEPAEVPRRYIVRPEGLDMRTKDGKAWAAQAGELEILTPEQYATAEAQRDALLSVPELAALLQTGRAEVSCFWQDPATDLACRMRADWVHTLADGRVTIVDVKTAADASPQGFSKAIAEYGYHRQAAMYSQGYKAATGAEVASFVFATVSNAYPFIATAYVLDDEAEAQGFDEVAELLELYAQCLRTNYWPGFGPGFQVVSLPKWARREIEVEIAYV